MIKGEFEVRINGTLGSDNRLTAVTGWEFAVYGYFNCVVHRDVKRPNEWTVSEPRTGMFITRGHKTRKGAISAATTKLYKYTQTHVLGLIDQYLNRFEVLTKYEMARRAQEEGENGRLSKDQ